MQTNIIIIAAAIHTKNSANNKKYIYKMWPLLLGTNVK